MLMSDIKTTGNIPLLLDGEQLATCLDDRRLRIRAEGALNEQYGKDQAIKYWQLDAAKRVVIIDNFHKTALNRKGKDNLVTLLCERFGHVILLAGEEYRLEELASPSGAHLPLLGLRQC